MSEPWRNHVFHYDGLAAASPLIVPMVLSLAMSVLIPNALVNPTGFTCERFALYGIGLGLFLIAIKGQAIFSRRIAFHMVDTPVTLKDTEAHHAPWTHFDCEEEKTVIRIRLLLAATLVGMVAFGCSSLQANQPQGNKNIVFQVSTISALLGGAYDGNITYKEVKRHGDFGLGTFNHLDGEMIAVDGEVYQIKTDGKAYVVDGSMKTPFAAVTFFEPDRTVHLDGSMDCKQLEGYIDKKLPTKNIIYAIRVEGLFAYVKARSVPKQAKPYPPLAEVVKHEVIFEYYDTEGTIVGFRFPTYMGHINEAGYHFHFINAERSAGGHVHQCRAENVRIGIDYLSRFHMTFPDNTELYKVNVR